LVLKAEKNVPEQKTKDEEAKPLDKTSIEKTINRLKLALKYSDKEQSKNIEKQLKSLQIALKYS
jgi:hypothetical protein